ncbi:MAG: ABC transporter ATP-binding protein [Hyphomicrobiales bacterium]|nr:MAG: ABC transporter ATP-binding protein [Hyphomicrobiales bacterium]
MIRAERISKTFSRGTAMETPALRGLDLEIPAGQFVTVIGSNGAGKSTLLGALAGETIADEGRVLIDDIDVTNWPTFRRAALVARVFQDPLAGSCGALTIEENLSLAASRGKGRGLARAISKTSRDSFQSLLARLNLGLENRMRDKMELLSGGQRQAMSLLMATLKPMKILLLDEHTAALDPKTAGFVLDLTRQIVAEQKLTTLMVTHSMSQALAAGDRTVMLHQGRIILDVSGDERAGMTVQDLLDMFHRQRGEALDDDSALD